MNRLCGPACALVTAVLLAACGSDTTTSSVNTSVSHGQLTVSPFRIASVDAATFTAQVSATTSGAQLLQVTGAPTCGVDFYYIRFMTVGGHGEATESSGALMVPTGAGAQCSGARPIVLYAHGTQTNKLLNLADITNTSNTEGALIAAMFAAQGYIVIAPNYAGYDISTLGYHPFLNAAQQSGEMIDALNAGREALPKSLTTTTTDSGKLFLTGYSEGGHVAMATLRAMEAAGTPVAAAAPMSGPYALNAFGDAIFFGNVDLDSTIFAPLLTTSYQHAYGNIYSTPSDIYSSTYATGIDTLLPSATPITTLIESGKLPETALFDSTTPIVPNSPQLTALLAEPSDPSNPFTALFDLGFGNPYLINNSVRVGYAVDAASDPDGTATGGAALPATAPSYPLRDAFYLNDLRNGSWAPNAHTLLCGGDQDPTVFFSVNTGTMAAFWSGLPTGLITVLDVSGTPAGPFAMIQGGFQLSQAQLLAFYQTAAGGGLSAAAAQQQLVENYHENVAPFCSLAARSFFSQF